MVELIAAAIADEPAATFEHGGVIRKGFSEELDKIRAMASDARQFLAGLEKAERERTGIRSLKLGYNRVFGYYIEVSQSHLGPCLPIIYAGRRWPMASVSTRRS